MKTRRPKSWRPAYLLLGACSSCYLLFFIWYDCGVSVQVVPSFSRGSRVGTGLRPPQTRFDTLRLTTEQCEATFPGLTKDLNDTVSLGPFNIQPSGDGGPLQVKIEDGQLFIFQPNRTDALSPELLDAQTATLHQLHRAIITSPAPLPDTIITVNVNDQPFGSAFSYTRPAFRPAPSGSHGPPLTRAFLMPHFSFWTWPLPSIGSVSRVAAALSAMESQVPFRSKDHRLAWRGTMGWNSPHYPGLRENLLRVTEQAKWADVQALHGYGLEAPHNTNASEEFNSMRSNALMIEDFCRYKYVLYTEGITYSGRLQFLQMCRSVLVSPPIAWLQHSTHLIKPLFSSDILILPEPKGWQPYEGVDEAWPVHYPPEEANAVFVSPDWSDLERIVAWLEENPGVAEGIAERQRELFVGKGYLSPAAEVCYWRALIRGWSEAGEYESHDWGDRETVSWELFSLGHDSGKSR
ncbi:hypothetical protein CONLIGDRAFT_655209 [Coniochaeta ligniaria NRRL 30616]|uniref:Glycosyl transferase CAP10 domain-containing protein n=1 Tax=Coniochaeta ligniaria NRRL 30616 TaxID=1408157 RepID=A0A1J7IPK3_9PEZI|nr:hypothetical protein CONLIGDRAFT_655209 [Coniochaeta ligniaria NRRL 30616]